MQPFRSLALLAVALVLAIPALAQPVDTAGAVSCKIAG